MLFVVLENSIFYLYVIYNFLCDKHRTMRIIMKQFQNNIIDFKILLYLVWYKIKTNLKWNQYFLWRNLKNLIYPRKRLLLKCRHLKRFVNRIFNNHILQAIISDRQYLAESNKLCCIDYICWIVPYVNLLQSFLFSDEYTCFFKKSQFVFNFFLLLP